MNQTKEIVQKINNECRLGLEEPEVNLESVISKIKELITKPDSPVSGDLEKLQTAQATIQKLQDELNNPNWNAIQQKEYQKILKLVKGDTFATCEKLGIKVPKNIQVKIEKANTLEEVLQERNNLIKARLMEMEKSERYQKEELMKE